MNAYEQLTNVDIWSANEFGKAELGNSLRVERLVLMARTAANGPAGKITEVYKSSAERQAAYKFLENTHVDAAAIGLATHVACAERCKEEPFVFVAVDGSSLSINDREELRDGLGPVGPRSKGGRGLEVMNAIAVRQDGTPLGLCGQAFWARSAKKNPKPSRKRPLEEKETRYWFTAIGQTLEAFARAKSTCVPWFQLDRGGDFRELLGWAAGTDVRVTVRAAQNRRIADSEEAYIWGTVAKQKVLGQYLLEIPPGPYRRARTAKMSVRCIPVTLRLPNLKTGKNESMTLYALQTKEVQTTPDGEKPIEWLLLTNVAVTTFQEACQVIYGYAQRWRVEEFHKTWKSVCHIEATQLEEASRIIKWAVILAAIAMRIERLKYLARTTPDMPATEELTRQEIDAILVLRAPEGYQPGDIPSIGLAVRWIADLGGYTGKSSGGPPGSIVIGRGLFQIALLAQALLRNPLQLRRGRAEN